MGVRYDDRPGQATDGGSAYVFVRSDTGWTKQAKLTDPAAVSIQEFGKAVALDGDTLAVAPSLSPKPAPKVVRSRRERTKQF